MLSRRRALQLTAAAIVAAPEVGWAQGWPTRPIRAIVPYTSGGASDIIGRVVCEQLSQQLGQPIVVENRGGAGGTIGSAIVAKSDPDGYTFLINSITFTITAVTYAHLPYDTEKDFSAVVSFGAMPNLLLVSPKKGYKTVRDLVDAARKNPGSISYASGGVGSMAHLSGERFKLAGKFKAVHVPYKGAGHALVDTAAGRVDFFIIPYLAAKPFMDNHSLIALAVASDKRTPVLPDVPTMAEAGFPKTAYPFWNMIFVPAKTPRAIVNKMHDETTKALAIVKDKLAPFGIQPMNDSPAQLDAIVRKQIAINAELVKLAGIKVT
jgi:tripartite-type tricarboxylate transporter receptor subunit TctC